MRVSVIVPAFNEGKRIRDVLTRIAAVPVDKEVIVVNDASTDDTAAILDAVPHLVTRRRTLSTNSGKGAAIVEGLKVATGDVVLVQDADGELDPAEYPLLLAPFADPGVQAVFGSRFMARGASQPAKARVSALTRVSNWGITEFANLLYGCRLSDVETGFKVCRRELLLRLNIQPSRYEFEVELTAKLLRSGVTILEVPISYYPRPRSQKTIGFRDGVSALRVLASLRLRRLPPSGAWTTRPSTSDT